MRLVGKLVYYSGVAFLSFGVIPLLVVFLGVGWFAHKLNSES